MKKLKKDSRSIYLYYYLYDFYWKLMIFYVGKVLHHLKISNNVQWLCIILLLFFEKAVDKVFVVIYW